MTRFEGKQIRWQGKLLGYRVKTNEGVILVIPKRKFAKGKKKSQWFKLFGGGWNINAEFLQHEIDVGTAKIVVKDETNKVYTITPSRWKERGIPFRAKGVEPQISLKEESFDLVV
jgi:hypothetical protein